MINTKTSRSQELFDLAQQLMPGGVNSPVRAFKSVGGIPRFIDRGEGAYTYDVDGNQFVDYVLSWGPLAVGHANPDVIAALTDALHRGTSYGAPTAVENQLAEQVINLIPSVEMIRFVNSGTEATMSALRLARAHTKREKIVKFAGCYHGHADMLLVQAGSGVATLGLPDSPGVPQSTAANTLTAPFNDLDAVRQLFESNPDEIAAVITEPIAANMGFVQPDPGYLKGLQDLCHEYGALFILDEVMTGFRVSLGGAQAAYDLDPDITCLGKVIGGGLPVGAYAGKREIMQTVAPVGSMYQAGTLSGNPLAMTAGLTTLQLLTVDGVFNSVREQTNALANGMASLAHKHNIPIQVGSAGTMFGFYFLSEPDAHIRDYATAKAYAHTERYAAFFHAMLDHGIYFAPSQFEAGFVSTQHTADVIDHTLQQVDQVMAALT